MQVSAFGILKFEHCMMILPVHFIYYYDVKIGELFHYVTIPQKVALRGFCTVNTISSFCT